MKSNTIWTVTTLHIGERNRCRTWGYYFSREEAITGLFTYVDDECKFYSHAVIENFTPGIYSIVESEEWFKFVGGKNNWRICQKPKSEKFIMG